ncbi:hypothetical protein Tco_1421235, partial [Tanacetum coccineum]
MEGKGSGGSKQTLAKNPDAPVTKGELCNEIKRIMKATEKAEKKKRANEEAERRRKAMEDKRDVEDQERKRKSEQDRKNTEDAKRLRNEEAEIRRRNAKAQEGECSYKSFLNYKPSEFHRDSDSVIVTNWLREIEDIFEINFEDLEMENYCPQGLMDKLEEEFLKLQQNDMTVPKYTAKFNEKARFAKYQ